MNQKNSDEKLVDALMFSNQILLDACFTKINLLQIHQRKDGILKQKPKIKSKFQKVHKINTNTSNKSNKQISFINDKSSNNVFDEQIVSRVKINKTELDAFNLPTYYHQTSSNYQNNNNLQTNTYTMDSVLKSTSISGKNRGSPIQSWNINSKQKNQDNFYNNSSSLPYVSNFTFEQSQKFENSDKYGSQNSNSNNNKYIRDQQQHKILFKQNKSLTANKSKGKFQKKKPFIQSNLKQQNKLNNPSMINNKQGPHIYGPDQDSIAIDLEYIYPKKNHNISLNEKQFIQNLFTDKQGKIIQDFNQRETCQLPQSKLQKLIQVQDNKYKQIVLKTLFKFPQEADPLSYKINKTRIIKRRVVQKNIKQ